MSITSMPNGKIVVRTALTLDPRRDPALARILQEAERAGSPLAAVIVDLMRTGLPGDAAPELETDEAELVDLAQLAFFIDAEEETP